uniref:PH domain-containing protein n=1 Tax=Terrapene triunguis TaxID=2587831 RepID=A0A674K7Z8_9SAUR
MKLHETSVLGYSRMAAPPDRQGRLYKKSERTSSYQRRWCELRGNLLFYWERQGDREPLGLILLEGCTVELQESATEPFTFKISYTQGPLGGAVGRRAGRWLWEELPATPVPPSPSRGCSGELEH